MSLPTPRRVALVCGARPNFVKIAPLYHALHEQRRFFEPLILHTGQHYDRSLSDVFFAELDIPCPDICLEIGSGTHAEQTAGALIGIERFLLDQHPDLLVCVGDVNSTLAAALAAVKCGVRCAHVEAGLRSGDRGMPEEINRIVVDHIADWLYTTSSTGGDNLRREGIDSRRIVFAGNVMIDTLLARMDRIDASDAPRRFGVRPGEYVLLTMHRSGNVDVPDRARRLVEVIRRVSASCPLVFPIHPRTRRKLMELLGMDDWHRALGANLRLCEPMGYIDFLALQKSARAVLTDSGGVQEETTVLGVPCLTLRESTERPVTLTDGTNTLVGLDPQKVMQVLNELPVSPHVSRRPPFWDGHAAERIIAHMRSILSLPEEYEPAVDRAATMPVNATMDPVPG